VRAVTRLLAATAAIVSAIAMVGQACKPVEVIEPPDAGLKECKPGPVPFCAPAAPNDPGCSSDDPSSKLLAELPRATKYPPGCAINFVGGRDTGGDCVLAGICRCVGGDAGTAVAADGAVIDLSSAVRWTCYP
jgi:hypothetical protein